MFLTARFMVDHYEAREHFTKILQERPSPHSCIVSLGDIGESKSVDETKQLFSGTSGCFKLVREYLDGFGVPFEMITGNHDLEGIDEFKTDKANMDALLTAFDKPTPQFKRLLAHKTMLIGLSSVKFRDAQYTSHEVLYFTFLYIDYLLFVLLYLTSISSILRY